ncbi:hypothetical protein [Sulfitobacter aestuariivivens]
MPGTRSDPAPHDQYVRDVPPLVITSNQIDRMFDILEDAIRAVDSTRGSA